MSDLKKIQFYVPRKLYDRIMQVAERGEITDWGTAGLVQGVSEKEEELIRNSQRQNLLAQLKEEKAS